MYSDSCGVVPFFRCSHSLAYVIGRHNAGGREDDAHDELRFCRLLDVLIALLLTFVVVISMSSCLQVT